MWLFEINTGNTCLMPRRFNRHFVRSLGMKCRLKRQGNGQREHMIYNSCSRLLYKVEFLYSTFKLERYQSIFQLLGGQVDGDEERQYMYRAIQYEHKLKAQFNLDKMPCLERGGGRAAWSLEFNHGSKKFWDPTSMLQR